jgi:hypothetical protein
MSKLIKYNKNKKGGNNTLNCDSTIFYSEISDKKVTQLPGLNYDNRFQENLTNYIQELYKNTLVSQPNTFEQDKPYLVPFLTYIRSFNQNSESNNQNKLFTLLYLFGRELDVNNIYLNNSLEIGKNNFKQICGEISENARLQCAVQIVLPTIFKKLYAIYMNISDFSEKYKKFFIFYQDTVANATFNNDQKKDAIQDFLNNNDYEVIKQFNTNLIYLLITLQTSGEKILEYINIHFIQQENMKAIDSGLDTVFTYLIGNSYDNPTPNSTKEQVFNYIINNISEIDKLFGESISQSIFESNIFINCEFDKTIQKVNFNIEKKSSFILTLNNGLDYSQPLAILYLTEKYDFTNDIYEQIEKFRWIIDPQSLQNIIICSKDAFTFLKCIQPVNEIKGLNLSSCNIEPEVTISSSIDSSSNYGIKTNIRSAFDKASQIAVKAKDISLKNPEAVGIGTTMAAVGSALGTLAYYGLIFGGNKTRKTNKRSKKITKKRRMENY